MLLDGFGNFRIVIVTQCRLPWRFEEDEDILGKGDLIAGRLHGDEGREEVEEGVVRKTTVGSS